jgi:type II secretory pathway component PulF
MPEYNVRIISDDGVVQERVVTAESKLEIYQQADERNEMVMSIKEATGGGSFGQWLEKRKKIKPRELENFTSQLAIMFRSGVPLISSLEALTEQAETETMRKVIDALIVDVSGGLSLSQAMEKFPGVFSLLYVNMIRAGESAGVMDQILVRLGSFIRHDLEVSNNVKSAMRYPMIVGGALVSAFVGAVVFIIPKFATMFEKQGIDLPLPTKVMIFISEVMVNYWWAVAAGVVVSVIALRSFLRTEKGEYAFDSLKLKMPVFKDIFLKSTIARFAHMLETLSRGGIQIIRSMETCEKTVGNAVIGRDIRIARETVAEGISLADALAKSSYFPKMTIKMISVGEQAGALDDMLENIAYQYDTDVDSKIRGLSAAIEPMMTVVMGGVLLFLALGIFLPMWNMYGAIK